MTIIGKGSYGTVYRPPIPCDKKFNHKNIVGKVFSEKADFEDEIEIATKIQKLNSSNKFSIPFYETCPENLEIIYADGGKDLYEYLAAIKLADKSKELPAIMTKMKSLIEGINILLDNGYVHQDIKLQNIVYNGKNIYLIDFGLMVKQTNLYKNDSFLKYTYLAFPPEFKRHYYGKDFIPQFFKNIGPTYLKFIKIIYPNYLKDLKALKAHGTYPTDKMDIYSLGMVIMEVYMNYKYRNNTIESLIKDMICFNPTKRLTASDILKKYY